MTALTVSTGLSAAAILVLVVLSGFFSSSETAIFTLPNDWIAERAGRGDPAGTALRDLRQDPHRLLVTILVGNNVVNVAIASITTVLVGEILPAGSAVSVATVLASALILMFGEIVPKSYGLGHARQWATTVALPLVFLERALFPLVFVFDVVTRRLNDLVGGETGIEKPYTE
jgi:Mg2+/Co2+ transporter CorB